MFHCNAHIALEKIRALTDGEHVRIYVGDINAGVERLLDLGFDFCVNGVSVGVIARAF